MIQSILNSKKIKYVILNKILMGKINQDVKSLNLFIDLDTVLSQLFSKSNSNMFDTIYSSENKIMLSSGIANIAAHYRHYFWTRKGKPCKIYFYYSDKKATKNLLINNSYKKEYYKKRLEENITFSSVQKIIKKNYDICEILMKYLPDVYFINTGDLEPNLLPHYIINEKAKDDELNILFTKDEIQYQAVNLDNTYVIKLESDKSILIDKYNLFEVAKYKNCNHIGSELYTLLRSFSSIKKYSLDGISGIGKVKAVKLLTDAIEKGIVINTNYFSITELLEEMKAEGLIKLDSELRLVERNFDCINYKTLSSYISEKHKGMIDSQMINLYNNKKLIEINSRFYHDEPLMLLELAEGKLKNV